MFGYGECQPTYEGLKHDEEQGLRREGAEQFYLIVALTFGLTLGFPFSIYALAITAKNPRKSCEKGISL